MTQHQITGDAEHLHPLFLRDAKDEALAKLMETVWNRSCSPVPRGATGDGVGLDGEVAKPIGVSLAKETGEPGRVRA
ncbi:hypothetical protein [Calditerricola satsumensis]|uniref:Uncharacterized protein n=1 Tax=Calditerricola satsumensis TaxID=373054 RepID=A0A8J3F9Y7_9BACI|nr:hypothetical protein [Calditerricola satsumensis]GGJ95003.1 hypothetical protein GCM10007043_05990 [Calditerricola satsumensis]